MGVPRTRAIPADPGEPPVNPATRGLIIGPMPDAERPDPTADASPGFDQRLEKLESIVTRLEEGGLELEPAIESYREGVALLQECRTVLSGYRQQVEELTEDAEAALKPYAGDPDIPGETP